MVLVHDTGSNHAERVAASRGVGEIHAFGRSKLYPQRTREHLALQNERQATPASAPVYRQLVATEAETRRLEVITQPLGGRRSLEEQVLECLAKG